MSLQYVGHPALQQYVAALEQALYNHAQWHKDLIRTLICRLQPDKHDIQDNAHQECRFGQWYYKQTDENLTQHPGFIATGEAHKRMHQLAAQLLIHAIEQNIVSPFDYDHFANALEQMRLELSTLQHELESLLYERDPLTGAINRINMLPLLRERQEAVKRLGQPCCIAMADVDLFKKVNDQYGHLVGDKVLAAISRFLIEHLRPYDKVFRYGGEEFLLCIQDTELSKGYEIIERIREDLAATDIDVGLEKPLHVTISIGLTLLEALPAIEDAIQRADQAMYSAKAAGRNRTEVSSTT